MQDECFDTRVGESRCRRQFLSGDTNFALSHDGKRAVCERREVTGASEAPVLSNDRSDTGIKQGGIGFCDYRAYTRAAGRHGREAQEHGSPHDLAVDFCARACRMAAHERTLELHALVRRDVLRCKSPEASGDPVVRAHVVRKVINNAA